MGFALVVNLLALGSATRESAQSMTEAPSAKKFFSYYYPGYDSVPESPTTASPGSSSPTTTSTSTTVSETQSMTADPELLPLDAPCDFKDFNRCAKGLVCSPSRPIHSQRQQHHRSSHLKPYPGMHVKKGSPADRQDLRDYDAPPVGPSDSKDRSTSKPTFPVLVDRNSPTTKQRDHVSPNATPPRVARKRNNSCDTAAGFGCSCQHPRPSKKGSSFRSKSVHTVFNRRQRTRSDSLSITIHYGRNLRDTDPFFQRTSDPYVKISTSNGRSAESPVVNNSLNPDFNFTYVADVRLGDVKIAISVWDKNHKLAWNGDELIGKAVPFFTSDISSNGWIRDLVLRAPNENGLMLESQGHIRVSCRWLWARR